MKRISWCLTAGWRLSQAEQAFDQLEALSAKGAANESLTYQPWYQDMEAKYFQDLRKALKP